ncbi:hypothetical protein [Persephonella sp.]
MNNIKIIFSIESGEKIDLDKLKSQIFYLSKISTKEKYFEKLEETIEFFDSDKKIYRYIFKVGYPVILFEKGIFQILNIIDKLSRFLEGYKIKVVDLEIPEPFLSKLKDKSVKSFLSEKKGPVISFVPNKYYGLNSYEYSSEIYELFRNGAEFVVEDTVFDGNFLISFEDRLKLGIDLISDLKKDDVVFPYYIPSVSGSIKDVLEKIDRLNESYLAGFNISLTPYGIEVIRYITEISNKSVFVTVNPIYFSSITLSVVAKLLKLAGVSVVNIELDGSLETLKKQINKVVEINEILTEGKDNSDNPVLMITGSFLFDEILMLYKEIGNNLIINLQGSPDEHPDGYINGVKALAKFGKILQENLDLKETIKSDHNLKKFLEHMKKLDI